MRSVARQQQTINGIRGVRFDTDARQGTSQEAALQRIQSTLSGGETSLGSNPTVAHLSLVSVQVVDGPSYAVITLWVPSEQETEAARLLSLEGFDVK